MYTGTAASLYSRLESDRDPFLRRARDCSSLTIPTLIPPQGHSHATIFPTTFQGLGARGVNHLAASLLMSLLPPNQPFFRLLLDEEAVRAIGEASEYKTEIDQTLSSIERAVMQQIETLAMRAGLFEALKHLIVGGNTLMYLTDEGLRVFHLDQFVVKRDPMGRLQHIVVKETVSPTVLPDEAKAIIMGEYGEERMASMDDTCDLYTMVCRVSEDKFDAWQEIKGIEVPGSRGSYKAESLPWFALRMNRVDGESYGRGYVEEYLGDLKSLESLMQAIVEGSAAAAKVLFLVNPNGLTDPETLSRSPNGAIREGMASDVSVLQVQKQADFSIALQTIGAIRERLSYAFLLAESTIRNAERVTAEEVRLTTAAVERQLGGIYSILSQEFQLPLVARLMDVMQRKKKLPKVPKEFVKPVVITGVDALGRGNDLAKLDAFLAGIQQTFGPQAVGQYIDISEYLSRRATSLGIDPKGLVKNQEALAADQNQAMQMQMMDKLGPAAVNQLGKGLASGAFEMPQMGAQSSPAGMQVPPAAGGMMGQ